MGSEKIFMFGEPSTGGRADLTAILPALMNNNKGIDPNILAMLGNRDGNGRDGFGNDFFAILLLFILMGWGGNNNGGFFGNRGNTVMTGTIVTMTSLKCVVVEEDGECDGKGSLLFQ